MVMHDVLGDNRGDKSAPPYIRGNKSDPLKAYVIRAGVVFCSATKARCVQCEARLKHMKKTNGCALLVIDHP